MIKVSRTEFLQMFKLGILKTSRGKNFTVTCRNKPAKRKKRYVDRDQYALYLKRCNENNKQNDNKP